LRPRTVATAVITAVATVVSTEVVHSHRRHRVIAIFNAVLFVLFLPALGLAGEVTGMSEDGGSFDPPLKMRS
jgi:predicted membrane-bound mannosyltransferase